MHVKYNSAGWRSNSVYLQQTVVAATGRMKDVEISPQLQMLYMANINGFVSCHLAKLLLF